MRTRTYVRTHVRAYVRTAVVLCKISTLGAGRTRAYTRAWVGELSFKTSRPARKAEPRSKVREHNDRGAEEMLNVTP